jgi:hypothetical protein
VKKLKLNLLFLCFNQVRVVATLSGDAISHADINLKLPRQTGGGGGTGGGVAGKDLYQV